MYLPVHKPTKEEWESKTYPRLKLKSEHIDWDPASTRYTEQEKDMPKYRREITIPDQFSSVHSLVINSLSSLSTLIADITNDDKFASMLENKIQVSAIKSGNVNSNQGKVVDALSLSK